MVTITPRPPTSESTGPDGVHLPIAGGVMEGHISFEEAPVEPEHLVNKEYLDTAIGSLLPKVNPGVSGWLNFLDDQTGIRFYGEGRIYKNSGGGMVLQKSSGGQKWQIEDYGGKNAQNIATENWVMSVLPAPATSSATIGDAKSAFLPNDHAGWIKLDGRAISTLTTTQQTAATGLGFTTNLPDATGAVPMQGGALGAISGTMERALSQANLPAVNLSSDSSGDHYHAMMAVTNENGNCGLSEMLAVGAYPATKVWNRQAGVATGNNGNIPIVGRAMENAGPHTHTVPLGGEGTPIDITPKSIAVNMFVYLGE
jgi:hypothetical protein